jgi:hypothetical protein
MASRTIGWAANRAVLIAADHVIIPLAADFVPSQQLLDGLKFGKCLPEALAQRVLSARVARPTEIAAALRRKRRVNNL